MLVYQFYYICKLILNSPARMKSQPFLQDSPDKNFSKIKVPQSVLRPYHSHLKKNLRLNYDANARQDHNRLKNKKSKIKSLFKDARLTNGETFLNQTKRTSKDSQRYFSSEKQTERMLHKPMPSLNKMKIDPTLDICINCEQEDLSLLINHFREPFGNGPSDLEEIRQGKLAESFDSSLNNS